MKNKLFISAFLLILVVSLMTSCQGKVDYEFPDYKIPENAVGSSLEMDEGAQLDGVLDEAFWSSGDSRSTRFLQR